jgi:hypothetical protein
MHILAACINQDSPNPAEQLNFGLRRIIGSCDFMVTPIFDPEWMAWSSKLDATTQRSYWELEDYKAPGFQDYFSRAYIRLDMFFNANMPVDKRRAKLFGGRLRNEISEGRRPHLVFGTRELESGSMLVFMPPLQDDRLEKYHPTKGNYFSSNDAVYISAQVEELCKINASLRV